MQSQLNILLLLLCFGGSLEIFAGENTAVVSSIDSTNEIVVTPAMRDSICQVLSTFEPIRPLVKLPSEPQLRLQLLRVVRFLKRKPVRYNLLLDEVIWEVEELPDNKKLELVGMMVAGGVAQKALQLIRKELNKRNFHLFIPSLQGARVDLYLPLVPAKMMLLMDLNMGATIRSTLWKGQISASYRQTKQYSQHLINLRLFKGFYLMGLKTLNPWTEYQGVGFSVWKRTIRFSFLYQKDIKFQNRHFIYLHGYLSL